jgi:hypothetical protein
VRFLPLATAIVVAGTLSAAEFSTYIGDANEYRAVADATGNTYLTGSPVLIYAVQ